MPLALAETRNPWVSAVCTGPAGRPLTPDSRRHRSYAFDDGRRWMIGLAPRLAPQRSRGST
jgi:hypothetical protein